MPTRKTDPEQQEQDLRDLVEVLAAAEAPLSAGAIGDQLGWRRAGLGPSHRTWEAYHYQRIEWALNHLRDKGDVVKLPHEGYRHGSTYALCESHEDASRMQLAATEAKLASLPDDAPRLRRRLLTQALVGLRAMGGRR